MAFQSGDRVCVASGPLMSRQYIGLCGTVASSDKKGVNVDVDIEDARKIDRTSSGKNWRFTHPSWVLALIDDAAAYVPEDWS